MSQLVPLAERKAAMMEASRKAKKRMMFKEIKDRTSYTYDLSYLKSEYGQIIPLFVYDQLMQGHSDNHQLKNALYFGPATTYDDDFILMKKREACLLFSNTHDFKIEQKLVPSDFKRVQGELYGVTLNDIFELDKGFVNGYNYDRGTISIHLHQSLKNYTPIRNAQVYFARYSQWKRVGAGEVLIPRLTPAPTKVSMYRNETVYRMSLYEHGKTPDYPIRDSGQSYMFDGYEGYD